MDNTDIPAPLNIYNAISDHIKDQVKLIIEDKPSSCWTLLVTSRINEAIPHVLVEGFLNTLVIYLEPEKVQMIRQGTHTSETINIYYCDPSLLTTIDRMVKSVLKGVC